MTAIVEIVSGVYKIRGQDTSMAGHRFALVDEFKVGADGTGYVTVDGASVEVLRPSSSQTVSGGQRSGPRPRLQRHPQSDRRRAGADHVALAWGDQIGRADAGDEAGRAGEGGVRRRSAAHRHRDRARRLRPTPAPSPDI